MLPFTIYTQSPTYIDAIKVLASVMQSVAYIYGDDHGQVWKVKACCKADAYNDLPTTKRITPPHHLDCSTEPYPTFHVVIRCLLANGSHIFL